MENDKVCAMCKWCCDEVCCNADSEYVADFRNGDDTCEKWESRLKE